MNFQINFANPEDIGEYTKIDKDMGFVTAPLVNQKAIEDNRVLVAKQGLELIGYLRYGYIWDEEMPFIQMVRVKVDARGQGVGRKLIEKLIEFLESKKVKYLLSSTDKSNENALKFHQSLGFEIVGELNINTDGIPELFLRKSL